MEVEEVEEIAGGLEPGREVTTKGSDFPFLSFAVKLRAMRLVEKREKEGKLRGEDATYDSSECYHAHLYLYLSFAFISLLSPWMIWILRFTPIGLEGGI